MLGRLELRDGDVLRLGSTVLVFRAPAGLDAQRRAADQSAITTMGHSVSGRFPLSFTQRDVLLAIARRPDADPEAAVETIARELSLSSTEVRDAYQELIRSFAVEGEMGTRQRERMIERALAAGLVTRMDLGVRAP